VEFLHGLEQLHSLRVTVISESRWSWVLGWAQLGVWALDCVAFTETSLAYGRQLNSILGCQGIDFVLRRPDELPFASQESATFPRVVCGHVLTSPGRPFLDFLCRVPSKTFLILTLSRDALPHFRQTVGGLYGWEELRHRRLGGLTTARIVALWRSGDKVRDVSLQPGNRRAPSRPLAAFLEPSVRLTDWWLASSH
jgi:hypothetical protein